MRALLFLSSLALPLSALPQARVQDAARRGFERLSDSGPFGVVTLGFDADDYRRLSARHASGAVLRLERLPLPGGLEARLELRPVSAMEPGARAQVVLADGSVALLAPRVRCFAGYAEGGGQAFLGITEGALHGYLSFAGELYFLSSGEAERPGLVSVAHASRTGGMEAFSCGLAREIQTASFEAAAEPEPTRAALVMPTLRTADVFIEADNVYRARFASDQACLDYTLLLMTAASEVYRRDLGAKLRIPDRYLRIWNTVPPWGVITGFNHLKNVYTYWQSSANPLKSLPRAAVQVLTSPIFGGTARGTGGLCDNVRAYEVASLSGRFPYPTQHTGRDNWDLFVVCHEFGHTFGSVHSQDYQPPIQCADGSGPDSGTLMSYCHTTYGIAKVGMRFHLREQQKIRASLSRPACLVTEALLPGDYDGDGVQNEGDLVALRGVVAQGFRSLAAEEVLDMDGDFDVDELDHDALAAVVYAAPPASVALRNGSGINQACLESLGNPVLGATWRTRILATGVGTPTLLVGYDQPHTGLATARGELLVRTVPLSGVKMFSNASVSDGTAALHELPLPLDAALFGLPVAFQGLVLGGTQGEHFCNALDVILSPYE
ncbi:MAG: hypothetical protein HOP15_00830 [Planctomycetes bacterium]|nr:hypothetical protein [Planctomycetota bacterium]